MSTPDDRERMPRTPPAERDPAARTEHLDHADRADRVDPVDDATRRDGGDHAAPAAPTRAVSAAAPVATPVAAPPVDDRARHADPVVDDPRTVQREVIAREKEAFGGIQWGSAFFGWLTSVGTAVLLTALVAGTGTALGLATSTSPDEAIEGAAQSVDTVGIVGAVLLGIIVFVAYYAGGYVAGRMARLSGAKQGVAVWVWALVIAVVVAIIGALGGADLNVLANLNGFPRLPIGEGELTTIGIVTAVVALLVSLLGAVVGGLAGMRFHRRVDRAGLGLDPR
ncbi:hypothetical protein OVN20_10000 [Microcella daejeonensis]|uniref:hypothetical protein n=1 Tax=Microcella daejeonensis TaxID=2994971 RepID=UPI00226DAADB|nr:hypothetical protein [Microcella daejeonensis]WAB83389.1 hypothetical protein OVN20_10000 [Microcella daejeonensis]